MSYVVAFALGSAQALSHSSDGLWWLQLATLGGAWALVQQNHLLPPARGPVRAGLIGVCFGLGTFVVGVGWVYVSMHEFGGLAAPLAAIAVVLLGAYLASFGGLAFWASAKLGAAHATPVAGALLFAGFWCLAEIGRGYLFTGFPWLAAGYAHIDGPLAHLASVLGVYGVGLFAALSAATAAAWIRLVGQGRASGRQSALAFAVIVLPLALGTLLSQVTWSAATGQPLNVSLLQGNVPQSLKFQPGRARQAIQDYTDMVATGDAQLYILPETAWVAPLSRLPADLLEPMLSNLKRHQALAAVGMPLVHQSDGQTAQNSSTGRPRLTNSVATINADGVIVNRYDKRHLVPFGEFIPWGFAWFVNMMEIPLGTFGRGTNAQPALDIGGQRIGFNICYEDLFGEEIRHQILDQQISIMANVSNIAWFGDSHALPQHLNIARMRSLEFSRPSIRATNTGVTALIDHRARVVKRLDSAQAGRLDVSVQGHAGLTAFARFGLAGPLACLFLFIAIGWRLCRREPT